MDTAPADPVAEEEATTKTMEEEDGILSKEQFCKAMETSVSFVHKDVLPFPRISGPFAMKGMLYGNPEAYFI